MLIIDEIKNPEILQNRGKSRELQKLIFEYLSDI